MTTITYARVATFRCPRCDAPAVIKTGDVTRFRLTDELEEVITVAHCTQCRVGYRERLMIGANVARYGALTVTLFGGWFDDQGQPIDMRRSNENLRVGTYRDH